MGDRDLGLPGNFLLFGEEGFSTGLPSEFTNKISLLQITNEC